MQQRVRTFQRLVGLLVGIYLDIAVGEVVAYGRKIGQARTVDYHTIQGVADAHAARLGIEYYIAPRGNVARGVEIRMATPAPVSITGT